jgi:beta-propeller repeat-containing protein
MKRLSLGIGIAAVALMASCVDWMGFSPKGGTTGGGGSGGSGGGAGGVCGPGAIVSCYDGPSGTEGKGLCAAGSKTCAADGASWGPCEGAITPQPESCAMLSDQDCDGLLPTCKGDALWSRSFGGRSYGFGIAADSDGSVLVTGDFDSPLDLGIGPPLINNGGINGFIVKLSAGGNAIWGRQFGGVGNTLAQRGERVAVDGAGNVLITGYFTGSIDFGGDLVLSKGFMDGFVAKLDPSGKLLWLRSFGDENDQTGQSIAVDSAGNVLVTGYFIGSVDFGGGFTLTADSKDEFVLKLDPDGNPLWTKRFGHYLYDTTVAVDGAGNVLLAASFSDPIDFGAGVLVNEGGKDVFVAKLDAGGNTLWSKSFGDAGGDKVCTSVAVDGAGNVLITGVFTGSLDFGIGPPLKSVDESDCFVAKLDANGDALWGTSFSDKGKQLGTSIAVDGAGNVLVTGEFSEWLKLGDSPLLTAGGGFLVKLDPNGGHVWSRGFGGTGAPDVRRVAVSGGGEVLITGAFSSTIDFGGGPLTATSQPSMFVAKFSP